MARIKNNPFIAGASGSVSGITLRQVGNTTVMSARRRSPRKQSENQKQNNERFRRATQKAKALLKDPDHKAFFDAEAKRLGYTSGYTAAIQHVRRKENGDTSLPKPKHLVSTMNANQVKICIQDQQGNVLDEGFMLQRDNEWIFKDTIHKLWITIRR